MALRIIRALASTGLTTDDISATIGVTAGGASGRSLPVRPMPERTGGLPADQVRVR